MIGLSIRLERIKIIRLLVRNNDIAFQNVIHVLDLYLNILFIERLKKNNYINYFN